MCTAATYRTKDLYFGRTLDCEMSYGDQVVVMPRNFPLAFLEQGNIKHHYAIIGMACVAEGYPLYYDAVNEKGLCIAGLNFVGNARYHPHRSGKDNVAQYEMIPWLLCQCATVEEAKALIRRMNILDTPFHPELPPAQLHWLMADREQAITLEAVVDGILAYENPVGVLTNNPPFPMQMQDLCNYRHLSPDSTDSTFAPNLSLPEYSLGLGALGLPGDLSSQSRFVRGAFTALNARSGDGEEESVNQFFHILGSVEQQRGCCHLGEGKYEITNYTSCCNAQKGIYYYTTYENHQITAVDMHREDLEGNQIACYPVLRQERILYQN